MAAESNTELTIDSSGNYVLEDMIVYRKADLKNVVYEKDGSLSVEVNNIETITAALDSGDGVPLNFGLAFAPNSIVMTAEGRHMFDLLLDSLRYIKQGVRFEVHSYPVDQRARLFKARSKTVVNSLVKRYGGKHGFSLVEGQAPPELSGLKHEKDRMVFTLVKIETYDSGSSLVSDSEK